jgi:uncharacterized OB-fold protein
MRTVFGAHDRAMWDSIERRAMSLQRCDECGSFRYPPGPACPACLAATATWTPISGQGEIISWAIFHRGYLPEYPPPYNVIAVRLAEGPILISNLEGEPPAGTWIGETVRLVYVSDQSGDVLPRFARRIAV